MKTYRKILSFIQGFPLTTFYLICVLLGLTIYLCILNFKLRSHLSRYEPKINRSVSVISSSDKGLQITKVESTSAKFSTVPKYGNIQMPNRILYWSSNLSDDAGESFYSDRSQKSVKNLGLRDSICFLHNTDDYLNSKVNSSQDSLVQFLLNKKVLELSFYNQGINKYLTKSYNLDLDKYQYNWTLDDGLTYKKKRMIEVSPYLQVRYQPFNKVSSLGTGISIKTRKLDYNIGFSVTHDHCLVNKIRPDLEVSANYKFKTWQK